MWLNIHAYVWRVIASYGFRFVLKNKYMTDHVEARLIRINKDNLRKKLACVTKRRICMRTEFCTRSIKDVLFWRRSKIGYVVHMHDWWTWQYATWKPMVRPLRSQSIFFQKDRKEA